jgi:SAM-dependent methyltransferase
LTISLKPCYTRCLDIFPARMRMMQATIPGTEYHLWEGIYVPSDPVCHREEEYPSHALGSLREMQGRHFWYQGRHRFVLRAVQRHIGARAHIMIDLGAGCGGWVDYLLKRAPFIIAEAALADSSLTALRLARQSVPASVACYQADLLNLPWENRWDAAFLLDVLEHLPRQEEALRQIHRALRPGGTLFLTAPALPIFWSWQDEAAGHQRRYTRRDFRRLASVCGFEVLEARYFMFFLSPLYLASRLRPGRRVASAPRQLVQEWLSRACRLPSRPLNALLGWIFHCETPLGHMLPFPWGTSLLGVFRKSASALPRPVEQTHPVTVRVAHDHVPVTLGA